MSEPITNLPDVVAAMGALPMPMGPDLPSFPPAPASYEQKLEQEVARLQGLLAEATLKMHGARRERDLIRERVSEPYGCTYCGVAQRSHGRRYLGSVGVHAWERPTDEQVKDRMLARRAARFTSHADRLAKLLVARTEDLLAVEARVAELEAERHTTNEALSQAAEALRANRDRIAELEGAAAVQRRLGYEAAIEVMRSEKLPMSVGLLEAQLELDKLDGLAPALTVYQASHDSIVMGHYGTREAARKHCETVLRREVNESVWIGWVPDDGSEDAPEELCFSEEVLCSGYVVTPLEVASEYDEEADE
ncbi:hypothetical protein [Streptomyces chartreusis]|uniref:hypothetical protein n=1 Tax=Streptomyces chartreusis TaxID=1969 RepID=UPI0035D5C0B9